MNALERRVVALLAGVYALRMAGLFLILPVFALYARDLEGHTPLLIGLAIGAYGLTQAIFQIPFGILSDRIGRKPVIIAGLLIFAIGSMIAASATSIWGVVIGRAVQGSGAIAAAVMALVADLTREEQRTKAMAIIGMTIGASFILSLVFGPVLDGLMGVPGIFWLTGTLAVAAIGVFHVGIPTTVRTQRQKPRNLRQEFATILRDAELLRLDAGVFVLHLVMTAMFVVLPAAIVRYTGLNVHQHWELYLPVMLAGFVAMLPFLMVNRKGHTRSIMLGSVAALVAAQLLFYFLHKTHFGLIMGLWLFFAAFSLLEAMLPSLVSRLSPVESKGAAIGVYSSSQFLGAFAGGALGGGLSGVFGIEGVFLLTTAVLVVWFLLLLGMSEPHFLATRQLRVGEQSPDEAEKLAKKLAAIRGVVEAVVMAEEGVVYLKVDNRILDKKRLEAFSISR